MPGFPVSTISSTHLAGTIGGTSGHQLRHIALWSLGRVVVVAVVVILFVIILLAAPVIWGAGAEAFSSAAARVAPGTFFLGLGLLFIGLVAGAKLFDIIGGSLAGLVVLGVIVDNYLAAIQLAAVADPPARWYPVTMW